MLECVLVRMELVVTTSLESATVQLGGQDQHAVKVNIIYNIDEFY